MSNIKTYKTQKTVSWQFLRGLSIIAVIACHLPGCFSMDEGILNYSFYLCVRQIVSFCTAVFIFMAGYFVNQERWQDRSLANIKSRLSRLAIPYLLYSFLYIMWDIVIGGGYFSVKEIIIKLLTGSAKAPLYYVIVLIQLTILTPALIRICKSKYYYVVYLISPIYWALLYAYIIMNYNYPDYYNVPFLGWIIFYYLGMNCKKEAEHIRKVSGFGKTGIVISMFLLCIVEAVILTYYTSNGRVAAMQMKWSSMLFAISICILFYNKKNVNSPREKRPTIIKFIIEIGNYSYGIFYLHEFLISIVIHILNYRTWFHYYVYYLAAWIIVTLLSFFAVKIADNLLEATFLRRFDLSRWLGLR